MPVCFATSSFLFVADQLTNSLEHLPKGDAYPRRMTLSITFQLATADILTEMGSPSHEPTGRPTLKGGRLRLTFCRNQVVQVLEPFVALQVT